MEKENTIIITAGGVGKRMGASIPKQFLELDGKPILMHAIHCFFEWNNQIEIIVTLPDTHIETWSSLCNKHDFEIEHTVVFGGKERFDSIRNALEFSTGLFIGVHDGVRPYVSKHVIASCFEEVKQKKAVVPVISVTESLRKITGNQSIAVDRAVYKIVQTPQVFQAEILKRAYMQAFQPTFTDDASVVEAMGEIIYLVDGNSENIKITEPRDLLNR